MKKKLNLLANIVLISASLTIASCQGNNGKIKVEGGWIQGTVTKDMAVYKGIPFAAPPVNDLRWKAPQPVIAWDGIRDATDYAPCPKQSLWMQ